jgi:hypothetical protein
MRRVLRRTVILTVLGAALAAWRARMLAANEAIFLEYHHQPSK